MNHSFSTLTRHSTWNFIALTVLTISLATGCGGDGTVTPEDTSTVDLHSDAVSPDTGLSDEVSGDLNTGRDILADTSSEDDAQIQEGGLGWPCQSGEDCDSGYCVASNEGPICTVLCGTSCREGYSCRSIISSASDPIFICIPDATPICSACTVDGQCGDGKCVPIGDGRFCSNTCTENENCLDGYTCSQIEELGKFCVPDTGACDCGNGDEGLVKSCAATSELGTCRGIQTCSELTGWSDCSAPIPAAETCNGLDDDCNGIPDDGFEPTRTCENSVDEIGSCQGTERCLGVLGWVCDAPTPQTEQCDYLDNDCDGDTDEDFKQDGQYVSDTGCGSCNRTCENTIPNATAVCSGIFSSPQCVVGSCNEGYHKVNEFQCISNMNTLCMPCAEDSGCLADGARCLQYDDGSYCSVPCGPGNTCLDGYICDTALATGDYTGQCVPASGRCGCDESNPNAVRACSISYQAEDLSTITCFGLQRCSAGEWGSCEMPEENCDGLDNDCDGSIDEDFRDELTGAFTSDEHCGGCYINCAVLSNPANASIGVCSSEGFSPECTISCETGYFDVDGEISNGCECRFIEGEDIPDGVDTDCDGIDGSRESAIFVSRTGNDTNEGSAENPLRTIGAGIDKAAAMSLGQVYVATGVYEESISLMPGISLYGGYSPDFRIHSSTLYESVVMAPFGNSAIMATSINGVGAATVVDGFTIYGSSVTTPGLSSYTIRIVDCDARLTLTGNRIVAGNGAAGIRGNPGTEGVDGMNGSSGTQAFDVGDTCGTTTSPGGPGGNLACGEISVNGGIGGAAICPDFDEDVPSGTNPTYPYTQSISSIATGGVGDGPQGLSSGGSPGFDQLIDPDTGGCANCVLPPGGLTRVGQPGNDGLPGNDGIGGPGCVDNNGTVVNNIWTPGTATGGVPGIAGSGGGGGGSGGGVETDGCQGADAAFSDLGGSGGGGGSGACPGSGGFPGISGGGSFGIFIVTMQPLTTLPIISGNTIRGGKGGDGGDGGTGGTGGSGGKGGAGGVDGSGSLETFCAPGGGKGGNGGNGGNGGGGGGGCGGPSYCVFLSDQSLQPDTYQAQNTCDNGIPGRGGLGGASVGAPGEPGSDGTASFSNLGG